MLIKYTDGRVVLIENVEKDCGCMDEIHKGPHWIYADKIWKEKNSLILKREDSLRGVAFAFEEISRLKEKEYQMAANQVVEIIR